MAVIERWRTTFGVPPHHIGVFLGTCALHVLGILFVAHQVVGPGNPLGGTFEVSFLPADKPAEPPPPAPIPVLLSDAFAEHTLVDIPAPTVEIAMPREATKAIHVPPPEPPPLTDSALQDGRGYGPFTKPRVISGPDSQDWYPRASVRKRETGRPIVKICISEAGTVNSVELARSSGYERLDQAAVDIGWGYVFAPAMREGKPVAVCLDYGIKFRIAVGVSGRR